MDFDYESLKKAGTREFKQSLKRLNEVVNTRAFFKNICKNFSNEISNEDSKTIINAITELVSVQRNAESFISGGFLSTIPFKKQNLAEEISNLLYYLVSNAPQLIGEAEVSYMSEFLQNEPEKSLVLISIYSLSYNQTKTVWPMIDILFSNKKNFSAPHIAPKYCLLLGYLCSTHKSFRKYRGEKAWTNIWKCISNPETENVNQCYAAACACASVKNVSVDVQLVTKHLQNNSLRSNVLSLLLVLPPREYNSNLVSALLSCASTDVRALLILCQIMEDEEAANSFIKEKNWCEKELPTYGDTFRLFLVVFKHQSVRNSIVASQRVFFLLNSVVSLGDATHISACSSVFRRLTLTEDLIKQASDSGFLNSFFITAVELEDNHATHAAFLVANAISEVCYIKELTHVVEPMCSAIINSSPLEKVALTLASQLCGFPKCVKKMKEMKLSKHLKGKNCETRLTKALTE